MSKNRFLLRRNHKKKKKENLPSATHTLHKPLYVNLSSGFDFIEEILTIFSSVINHWPLVIAINIIDNDNKADVIDVDNNIVFLDVQQHQIQ